MSIHVNFLTYSFFDLQFFPQDRSLYTACVVSPVYPAISETMCSDFNDLANSLTSLNFFWLFSTAILHNNFPSDCFGGMTEFFGGDVNAPMYLFFLGNLMALFKMCFKIIVCVFGLGPNRCCTCLEVDNTL